MTGFSSPRVLRIGPRVLDSNPAETNLYLPAPYDMAVGEVLDCDGEFVTGNYHYAIICTSSAKAGENVYLTMLGDGFNYWLAKTGYDPNDFELIPIAADEIAEQGTKVSLLRAAILRAYYEHWKRYVEMPRVQYETPTKPARARYRR